MLMERALRPLFRIIFKWYLCTTSGNDGSFTFTNVTAIEKNNDLPNSYAVANNYPNPFNPRTRIEFKMPETGIVRINVYNSLVVRKY